MRASDPTRRPPASSIIGPAPMPAPPTFLRCVVALLMASVAAVACVVHADDRAGAPARSRAAAVKPPNDPLFRYQWNLHAMQIPAAWAVSRGQGAVVAVLDTGVAYEDRGIYRRAPDLAGTRFVPGWDFVDGDAHPDDVPPRGRRSHGTQMAGIIAQTTDNGIGSAGVAPKAAIMPIRVLQPAARPRPSPRGCASQPTTARTSPTSASRGRPARGSSTPRSTTRCPRE